MKGERRGGREGRDESEVLEMKSVKWVWKKKEGNRRKG